MPESVAAYLRVKANGRVPPVRLDSFLTRSESAPTKSQHGEWRGLGCGRHPSSSHQNGPCGLDLGWASPVHRMVPAAPEVNLDLIQDRSGVKPGADPARIASPRPARGPHTASRRSARYSGGQRWVRRARGRVCPGIGSKAGAGAAQRRYGS